MVDVILLISGKSERMGREKALLPFSESESFICHLFEIYSYLTDSDIIVIVNSENSSAIKQSLGKIDKRVKFVLNPNPEKGRFWSILTGLKQMEKGRGVFIQNIDNPFISIKLLNGMLENYQSNSFLVPEFNGENGHPLLLGSFLVQELIENGSSFADLKSFLNFHQLYLLQAA